LAKKWFFAVFGATPAAIGFASHPWFRAQDRFLQEAAAARCDARPTQRAVPAMEMKNAVVRPNARLMAKLLVKTPAPRYGEFSDHRILNQKASINCRFVHSERKL
jgi:hypothetical protein